MVQENTLLLLSCRLVYLSFIDICHKSYSNCVEKYIIYFAVIYQDSSYKIYNTKLLHIIVYLKKLWKKDFKYIYMLITSFYLIVLYTNIIYLDKLDLIIVLLIYLVILSNL